MKFKVSPKLLKDELSFLSSVTDKDYLQILSNVLIETVDEETIRIKGTNLDTSIQSEVEAEIDEMGSICVSGRRLSDIVKVLEKELSFQTMSNGWVQLKSGTSKFKIPGLDENKFPEVAILDTEIASISSENLSKMVKATKFAINLEETRFSLSGVKFEIKDGVAKMVATDGHRIAYIEAEADGEIDVLIPSSCLNEMAKLPKGKVRLGNSLNHIFFHSGSRYLSSRKLSGNFPKYEVMFDTTDNSELVVNAEELKKAVQRVALMSDDRNRSIRFEITDDKIILSTMTADKGESEDEVPIKLDGKNTQLALNHTYLTNFLNNYEGEELHMSFNGTSKPVQFGYGNTQYKYVLMPMRM